MRTNATPNVAPQPRSTRHIHHCCTPQRRDRKPEHVHSSLPRITHPRPHALLPSQHLTAQLNLIIQYSPSRSAITTLIPPSSITAQSHPTTRHNQSLPHLRPISIPAMPICNHRPSSADVSVLRNLNKSGCDFSHPLIPTCVYFSFFLFSSSQLIPWMRATTSLLSISNNPWELAMNDCDESRETPR